MPSSVQLKSPLPESVTAEQAVIGSVLLSPVAIHEALFLLPAHFSRQDHATIWQAMLAISGSQIGQIPDIVILAEYLRNRG